jgi:NADH:ubiquinone oxidoreductase subunit 6 (subunit J)
VDSFRSLKPGSIFPVKHLLYQMGMALMQTYAIPFEVISALLLVALLGAFSLAREKEDL